MYQVKRAVIVAAGIGQRLRPVTLETPKPLVRVNGVRMIDTVLRALRENGIGEIYIVVGWRAELFADLEREYKGVTLIYNPHYAQCNNISSLYMARDHLEDAIILDGDQIIYDAGVLNPAFARSGYNCVWTEEETKEWLLSVEEDVVTRCSRTGGSRGWQLFSISRWSAEDGRRLKRHLELQFEKEQNRRLYWDDVPLFCYPGEYRLGVRPMEPGAVIEIDTLRELAAIDPTYETLLHKGDADE